MSEPLPQTTYPQKITTPRGNAPHIVLMPELVKFCQHHAMTFYPMRGQHGKADEAMAHAVAYAEAEIKKAYNIVRFGIDAKVPMLQGRKDIPILYIPKSGILQAEGTRLAVEELTDATPHIFKVATRIGERKLAPMYYKIPPECIEMANANGLLIAVDETISTGKHMSCTLLIAEQMGLKANLLVSANRMYKEADVAISQKLERLKHQGFQAYAATAEYIKHEKGTLVNNYGDTVDDVTNNLASIFNTLHFIEEQVLKQCMKHIDPNSPVVGVLKDLASGASADLLDSVVRAAGESSGHFVPGATSLNLARLAEAAVQYRPNHPFIV
ncbi:MAG: hypothetical protein EB060_05055 [Proteobacteria bacterium]|nr:hypothetical protein [Pseudomonadota bacterium]